MPRGFAAHCARVAACIAARAWSDLMLKLTLQRCSKCWNTDAMGTRDGSSLTRWAPATSREPWSGFARMPRSGGLFRWGSMPICGNASSPTQTSTDEVCCSWIPGERGRVCMQHCCMRRRDRRVRIWSSPLVTAASQPPDLCVRLERRTRRSIATVIHLKCSNCLHVRHVHES